MPLSFEHVAVVGAGTMGHGIAQVFAQHGHRVYLIDLDQHRLDAALAAVEGSLERLVRKGALPEEALRATLNRIYPILSLEVGVQQAALVVEAVAEDPAVKAAVFQALDRAAPNECILATNTSSISITQLGAHTRRPGQVIGMHFFNPVPVMGLIEVVRGLETSDETFETVSTLAESLGKTAIEVNDAPGFVSNRVLMPMINEAVFCVMEGVASVEAVDQVMKLGMNHPMGPLTLADFIGLDVCLSILEVLHKGLGDDKYRPCPLLRRMVAAGRLGRKSGQGFYDYRKPQA